MHISLTYWFEGHTIKTMILINLNVQFVFCLFNFTKFRYTQDNILKDKKNHKILIPKTFYFSIIECDLVIWNL